ncbi:MAG: AMP-binding protein [Bacteroidia bacterium]
MTIVIGSITYDLKDFLFKNIVLTQDLDSSRLSTTFLTKWISGGKEFEMFTSGTTGEAKKVSLKRKWLETSALQTIELLGLWQENVLCCLPINKIGGLMMIVRSLAGGFNLVIQEPKSNPMIDIESNHSFTFVSLVPSQLLSILNSEDSTRKLNRFKNVLLGGADLPTELILKIDKLKPNIYHTYGMTETCSQIALKKLNNGSWPHFKPNPFVEMKTNGEGWLSIRAFQTGNEWIDTKDIANIHKDGSFDFIGRADFMINTGGYKVLPEQLEQKIKSFFKNIDQDLDLAITSIPNEKWGNKIILVLTLLSDISENEILEQLKPNLEKYEFPKHILKLETIPRNEGGKIDRIKLNQLVLSVT